MTNVEREVFQLLHEGEKDVYIQLKLGLTRKAYQKIEDQVRRKTLTVVMTGLELMMRSK